MARRGKEAIDLTGQTFGRWTVLFRAANQPGGAVYWTCSCRCGTLKDVNGCYLRSGKSQSCGCRRHELLVERQTGPNHPRWKGGRTSTGKGYVKVRNAVVCGEIVPGYTKEHIVVMSNHIGRKLLPGESVHHRNGVRDDNRIENLELWSSSQPSGQRVVDLVEWAVRLLQTYAPTRLNNTDGI